eukprot:TRINITY_DN1030_c0_g1_i1.p1 TRINITY_DN1030_c0_g1~~TRINITY_DN1030_c0_g1_i1.p1  ORF type:complete len:530 (+),score=42.86 TRINITY_DN1030_c0_g1_i1:748-2337(+)
MFLLNISSINYLINYLQITIFIIITIIILPTTIYYFHDIIIQIFHPFFPFFCAAFFWLVPLAILKFLNCILPPKLIILYNMPYNKVLFLALSLASISCQVLRFGSFPGVPYLFNYTEDAPWCEPSFECEIMTFLCQEINQGQECDITIFDSLGERISALENNVVDIVVSRFSVTPSRAERVDFLNPYYYSSGAQMFTLAKDQSRFPSFESLLSYPVCMELGYFVSDALINEYGFVHFPSDKASFIGLMEQGFCVAAISDSTFILDGLTPSKEQPKFDQPYAVAISKRPQRENLANATEEALLKMFVRSGEEESLIEKFESQYLLSQGLQQNTKLAALSEAITGNQGQQVNAEDIWNSSIIPQSDSLFDKFVTIEEGYDDACEQALNDIYESYINGTDITQSPTMYVNKFHHTFILNVTQFDNLVETAYSIVSPFLEGGIEAAKKRDANPQRATILLIYQQSLSKEENREDGAMFMLVVPSDVQSENPDDFVSAPTRVLSTVMAMSIQGRREDEGSLMVAGCGVGELREW